jgi:diguanylate cyclase (GGDEF)-like protein
MPSTSAVLVHKSESRPEIQEEHVVTSVITRWMTSVRRSTARWVRSAAAHLGDPAGDEQIFDELADAVRSARCAAEIESTLVRLAWQMVGARQVELVLEPTRGVSGQGQRALIARWPKAATPEAAERERRAAIDDAVEARCPNSAGRGGRPTPLSLVVATAELSRTTLRLIPIPGQRWSPRSIRRLTTLCTLAAAARTALETRQRTVSRVLRPHPNPDPDRRSPAPTGLIHDEGFLTEFLPHAVAQAKRNHYSLTLICMSIDRFAAIQKLLGWELAEAAIERVGTTIVRNLRASDVVARIDEGRFIIALALGPDVDARSVATMLRQVTAFMGSGSAALPVLTTSIGLASYPDDATDPLALIDAAIKAVTPAPNQGPGSGGAMPAVLDSRIVKSRRKG